LGSLSNDLIGAAVPVLLAIGLIPPLAITTACWLAGNWRTPGLYRWWPSFLVNLAVNGVSLAIAAAGGLSVGLASRVVLYTLVQAVLQPASATLVMRAWPKNTSVLTQRDPVSPQTFVANAASWSF